MVYASPHDANTGDNPFLTLPGFIPPEAAGAAPPSGDPPTARALLMELARIQPDAHLDSEQIARLATLAEPRTLAPGEVLFEEGDPSDAAYLIVSGVIDFVQRAGDISLLIARGPGEFAGELGVIEGRPRSATARARGYTQTLRFGRDVFPELIHAAPYLAWRLMRHISAVLRQREQEFTARLQLRNRELAVAAARLQDLNNVLEQLVAERTRELAAANERLEALAVTDEVTGLYNRRFLQQILQRKAEMIAEAPHPFSVIMVDIDHFKHYNDRNGHLAGDGVLRKVCEIMRRVIRGGDIIARYGGEEFCIVLENAARPDALRVAEKLRLAVMEHAFPKEEFQPLGALTVSAGVASYPEDAGNVTAVLDAADQALYLAKNGGRNLTASLDGVEASAA
jgi:diguanylate cyclase (GGDEF)-like protein